ncbi:MAG: hypothetical protein WKG01_35225 [Kofleriaceae bacterium]
MGLIIAGVVVALVVMLVVVPLVTHRVIGPKLRARVAQVYKPDEIVFEDLRASNFGLESKGAIQARGNGALVLTARELHFFQLIPARDVRIPLDRITQVKTVRTHLGKTVGRSLLHVSFTVEGGQDAMAWSVTDVETWLSKLEPKPDQDVR